jgi:hypothetical protein
VVLVDRRICADAHSYTHLHQRTFYRGSTGVPKTATTAHTTTNKANRYDRTYRGSRQSLSLHEQTQQQIRVMDPTGKNQQTTGVPEHRRSASARNHLQRQPRAPKPAQIKEAGRLPPSGLSDPATATNDSQGFHYQPLHGQLEVSGANELHGDGLLIWK